MYKTYFLDSIELYIMEKKINKYTKKKLDSGQKKISQYNAKYYRGMYVHVIIFFV